MTREQHVLCAEWCGSEIEDALRPDSPNYEHTGETDFLRLGLMAGHHGRAALQCDRCGGRGSTPLPGSRYAGANIRCPACGGVGWGTEQPRLWDTGTLAWESTHDPAEGI